MRSSYRSEVAEYAERVAASIESVFQDRVRGVWLVGSHSYGGASEQSDIDIQACVRDATPAEVSELVRRISHPALPCPGAGLEFVLYDLATLILPLAPLPWLLNLNGGPTREHSVSTDPTTESWHWFILDLVVGRQFALTLRGDPLADVLGPIDRHVQVEALAESYRWHASNDNRGANQVANGARGLRFLTTGRWGSKPDGLAWARSMGFLSLEVVMNQFALTLVANGIEAHKLRGDTDRRRRAEQPADSEGPCTEW